MDLRDLVGVIASESDPAVAPSRTGVNHTVGLTK